MLSDVCWKALWYETIVVIKCDRIGGGVNLLWYSGIIGGYCVGNTVQVFLMIELGFFMS